MRYVIVILTVTFFPHWLKALEKAGGAFSTSLMPDRGGIEANLESLVGDEADFFLTYAHPEVPFHLDRGKFAALTVAHDRLVPLVAPTVVMSGAPHSTKLGDTSSGTRSSRMEPRRIM